MAWNDTYGELLNLEDKETYMHCVISFLHTSQRKTMSYKYGFFKSILDNLFNVDDNYSLYFNDLNISFARIYWNLCNKYELPQSSSENQISSMERIINNFQTKYRGFLSPNFDDLVDDIKNEYLIATYKIVKKDVVGALYSDLNSKIYGFNKQNSKIWFNKEVYNFLVQNKVVLEKLNYYSWIIWTEKALERRHQSTGNIAIKIDLSNKRSSLKSFKQQLFSKEENMYCFYCGKKISANDNHIDHFIPWSFVKDDQIWNLVPTCSNCNLRKNDKIPSEKDLNRLLIRNNELLNFSYEDKLRLLYVSALNNGFIHWEK